MPKIVNGWWLVVGGGFTLIELLVLLSIIAGLALFGFANYRSLKESQNLKNSSSDIQSLIRQAEFNAASRLNCSGGAGPNWFIYLTDATHLDLRCQVTGGPVVIVKTVVLSNNILINSIAGTCQATFPVKISFAPLTGAVTFADPNDTPACLSGAAVTNVTITVVNNNTSETKIFKLSQGGALDVQ